MKKAVAILLLITMLLTACSSRVTETTAEHYNAATEGNLGESQPCNEAATEAQAEPAGNPEQAEELPEETVSMLPPSVQQALRDAMVGVVDLDEVILDQASLETLQQLAATAEAELEKLKNAEIPDLSRLQDISAVIQQLQSAMAVKDPNIPD